MTLKTTPDVEDIGDIGRFCLNAWFRHTKSRKLAHVSSVDGAHIILSVGGVREIASFESFIENYIVEVPKHCYIFVDGIPAFVQPNVSSRTQQGFSLRATRFTSLVPDFEVNLKNQLDIATQVYYPTFIKAEDAFNILNNGEALGCALSGSIALVMPKVGPIQIFFHEQTIGHVEDKKPIILKKYQGLASTVEKLLQ